MRESWSVRFLYRTVPGRMCLKILTLPALSRLAGGVLSSGMSRWFIPHFIRRHGIDLREIEIPRGGFGSFNEFFTRKRRRETPCPGKGRLISPCDGFLSVVELMGDTVFDIKHTRFSLMDLLEDQRLAAKYKGGTALIFRLTPANYHRYCYAADGRVLRCRKIGGILHCVRPIATRTLPVYTRNSREYQVLETEQFGTMVQMEIGALLVGKIRNQAQLREGNRVCAGDRKGYFEFGGSTVLLLFERDAMDFYRPLYSRVNDDGEMPVRMGEWVSSVDGADDV